ncbi:MAG: ABC transporter ATP-binding protein [Clostridia bacterium]|nr:ABC transporter ATP-binding protein [Clostridia bacterium]
MLPLDTLSEKALQTLQAANIESEQLDVAFYMDLGTDARFGQVYLAISTKDGMLYRIAEEVDAFPLSLLTEPSIDNFTTSNRLTATQHDAGDLPPEKGEMTDEEFAALQAQYDARGQAVVVGFCTNTCKRKLLAFVNIWERLARGDSVAEDDPIFEQFNAKCPKCGKPFDDPLRRICKDCTNKKGTLRRLLGYFTPFKPQLVIVTICLLASTAISLISPVISGQILYDQVIDPAGSLRQEKYVYILVGVIMGLAVLSLAISIVQNRANAYMSTEVTKRMKNDIFRAMNRLSLSYFNSQPTGRLINRVNYDAEKVRNFFINGVPYLIVHALQFIGLTIVLMILNPWLTLMILLPVPVIVLIFKYRLPHLWRSFSRAWRASSSLTGVLNDSLSGIRVVKAFAKEDSETHQFFGYSTKLMQANLRSNLIALSIFPVISLIIGIFGNMVWGVGGIQVIGKQMSYGDLSLFVSYMGMIFAPLNFFSQFTNMLTDTLNSATRMFEVQDMVPEITDAPEAVELTEIKGDIEFKNVGFHYNPNRPILKDVSFTIHQGDRIGLVGHTGSGKSTIANLITRMYDVVSGSVTIDGVDIKQIKQSSLRGGIAIVSQEIFIFRGTIADNIRYGKPDATMDEVIAAARAANAHDFIMALPEGYETQVGIGSRSLSGGERQRVSIARALLLDPAILILDEATAAMDTETEHQISKAIDQLIEGKTSISIAHRLSTLKNCNYIMAMENGELVEMGTQEELMAKEGVYYKLWTLQNEQMTKVMQGK